MKIDRKILKRNQDLVMNCLQERPQLLSLSSVLGVVRPQNLLGRSGDALGPSIELLQSLQSPTSLFQTAMLDLLAMCGEGENRFCQSFLRSFLNSTQTLLVITSPFSSLPLKRAAVRFFLSIHLSDEFVDRILMGFVDNTGNGAGGTEDASAAVLTPWLSANPSNSFHSSHSPTRATSTGSMQETRRSQRLWDYLSDLSTLLSPISLTGKFQSVEERDYVVDAVLPFLDRFYSLLHHNDLQEEWLKEVADISTLLVDQLLGLAQMSAELDAVCRRRLGYAVESMVITAQIRGTLSQEVVRATLNRLGLKRTVHLENDSSALHTGGKDQQKHIDATNKDFHEFVDLVAARPEIATAMQSEFEQLCKFLIGCGCGCGGNWEKK
eukprot:jgi/Hompol1/2214/HPOL_001645-RA